MTLVASTGQIAALDAAQYLYGGPCVEDLEGTEPLNVTIGDLLDEGRWQMYAQASATAGIASSLSLPVMAADRVVGGVNLYASTADAFTGRHQPVAEAVGSGAAFAVSNADLSFTMLQQALEAPDTLCALGDMDLAVGVISESQGVPITIARERLRDAAAPAGISEAEAAKAIGYVRGK